MTTLHLLNEIFWLHPIFWAVALTFLTVNFTWVYYGWVMRMQMLRKAHKLELRPHTYRFVWAYFNLFFFGFPLDVLTNVIFSPVFKELPQWQRGEFFLSARMSRWYVPGSTEWHSVRAGWLADEFLNDIDPRGIHIK